MFKVQKYRQFYNVSIRTLIILFERKISITLKSSYKKLEGILKMKSFQAPIVRHFETLDLLNCNLFAICSIALSLKLTVIFKIHTCKGQFQKISKSLFVYLRKRDVQF